MKSPKLLLLFYFVFTPFIIAQERTDVDLNFNKTYEKIAVEIAAKNPELALLKADSLFTASQNKYQEFKSLMLKANVLAQIGNSSQSIETAKKAEIIASRTDYFSWQARIAGFISTQYRMSGLYSEAKKYLDKAQLASKKIKLEEESQKLLSFIYQEKADIARLEKNYDQAVNYLRMSGQITKKLPTKDKINYHLKTTNDAYLAQAFFETKSYDSARYYFSRATENLALSELDDTKLKSLILIGMGKLDMVNKEEKEGIEKIHEALDLAEESGAVKLTKVGNEELSNYYLDQNDYTNYQIHAEKTIASLKEMSDTKQKTADFALQEAEKDKDSFFRRAMFFIGLIGNALFFSGITIFLYWKRKKKEFRIYQNVIRELTENPFVESKKLEITHTDESSVIETDVKRKVVLPKETEEGLLRKLEKFEKGSKFTDKNISLSILSGNLGTNTKYLNHIISTYRNKNFSQYINHLRIKYILEKMQNSPVYLHYKISTLAEESGYSSHSKFTEAFKKEIGIAPSVFIDYLKKEQKTKTQTADNLPVN